MASSKVVVGAFVPTQKLLDATILGQCVEAFVSSTEQLVGIGLVSYIPDHPISTEIKHLEERYSNLYSSKRGG
jgi:hypothetical protein